MNKKILGLVIGSFLLAAGSVLACGHWYDAACDTSSGQQDLLFQNQAKLDKAVPAPIVSTSQERINLSKRAELFNSDSKISYIYLVDFGKVMAFYTIKGKVSSVSSYMVPQEQLVGKDGTQCQSDYTDCFAIQAPDIDGSYGSNGDAIFFFTTSGAYVEWKGDYMLADQPLQLATPPELTMTVK